jgi:hypothetical protein
VNGALAGLGKHIYYVTITDSNNCTYTDSIEITVIKFQQIELFGNFEFEIFPNPAENELLLSCPEKGSFSISIIDQTGKVSQKMILEMPIQNKAVNISEYPSGFYLIRIVGENKISLKRFLKM